MRVSRRGLILGGSASLVTSRAFAQAAIQPQAPYWAFPGAYLDCDFRNSRSWGGSFFQFSNSSGQQQQGGVLGDGSFNPVTFFLPTIGGPAPLLLQSTIGPKLTPGYGLWGYTGYTNACLWNRDLTNAAWTASNVTAAKNQIGADGTANAASSITATANLGTILQAITSASSVRRGSAYIKRISGTGTLEMTVDNGATWTAIVPTSAYTQLSIPSQTLANPTIGFRIGTSGDSFAVDLIQCQNIAQLNPASVQTTTATQNIATEETTFNSTAGFPNDGFRIMNNVMMRGGPWSLYSEWFGDPPGTGGALVSDSNFILTGGADGNTVSLTIGAGTVASSNTGNRGFGNWNRVAATATPGGGKICLNGGPVAFSAGLLPLATAFTHIGIGNNAAGTQAINGVTSRVAFWQGELTSGQLQSLSTLPA